MAKDYKDEIAKLIPLLGGKDNVSSAMNCVSRLRLVIRDMKLVDDKAISQLSSSRGTIKLPNNQYQVIIGPDVPAYFKEFSSQAKITGGTKEDIKRDAASKGSFMQRMMQHFSEIFIPLIPALVAGGIILGIRNIFEADFDASIDGVWKMVDESQFINGLNEFLWIPAQAVFWYLPVTICWSIFKKMGGSPVLGIILGLCMLLPPLINIYGIVYSTDDSQIQWIWNRDLNEFGFNFGSWQFPWKIQYTAQVVPAMGVAFVGVYIERLLNKWVTPVLRQIVTPLGVILIGYTLALVIIGPIGWTIGTAISFAVQWTLTHSIAKYFFAPIFGLLYAPLVVTGVHHMLNAVMIQNVALLGGTLFFPILAISNISQGAAALTYGIMRRKDAKIKQIAASATTAAWLGVTEPAMYGINLRFIAPFLAAITGSAIASLLLIISGVTGAGIGNGAWLGVLSIQAQSAIKGIKTWPGTGFLWFLISGLLATGIASSGTWFLFRFKRFQRLEKRVGAL